MEPMRLEEEACGFLCDCCSCCIFQATVSMVTLQVSSSALLLCLTYTPSLRSDSLLFSITSPGFRVVTLPISSQNPTRYIKQNSHAVFLMKWTQSNGSLIVSTPSCIYLFSDRQTQCEFSKARLTNGPVFTTCVLVWQRWCIFHVHLVS